MTPSRVTVLFNATAGTTAMDARMVARELGGSDAVEVRTVAADELREEALAAVRARVPLLGVAGGDGTMRAVAAVLAGTMTTLLPVPTGTLNHFALRCGIATVRDARTALEAGTLRTVPMGVAGETAFLNTLTLGEYARTVRTRERFRPRIGKWPAALVAFVRTVMVGRRIDVSLDIDGRRIARRTPLVWIGVGWGSFPRVHAALERRAAPDLEVAVLRATSRAGSFAFLLRLSWGMLRGRQPVRDRALDVLHVRSVLIDSPRRLHATVDGEVMRLNPPVRVTVRDDALRVLMPAPAGERRGRTRTTSHA